MTLVQAELSSARLSTELNTVLSYALDAHQCGCSIIPLRSGKHQVSGKRPRVAWQTYQTSHATSEKIHEWFDKVTSAYGIVYGQVSRLIVIDFDDAAAQAKFIQKFPRLMRVQVKLVAIR